MSASNRPSIGTSRWVIGMMAMTCVSFAFSITADAQLKNAFRRQAKNANAQEAQETENGMLSQSHGPWLIMCASFNGEFAEHQAVQLANELRGDHGLHAYLYRHTFDHSNKIVGSGWTEDYDAENKTLRQKNWQAAQDDQYDEIAVVVGNFASLDDNNAKATLQIIKRLQPRAMMSSTELASQQSEEQMYRAGGAGSLAAAFLMPNPILPPEYFHARDVDKVVVKLNKNKRYSLLKCPGRFSVRVATFKGQRMYSSNKIEAEKLEFNRKVQTGQAITDSELMDGGYKANVLCRALRKMGVEAYEFHDQHESYVCVGNFEWATRPLSNGKDELNPEIAKVILEYKADEKMTHEGSGKIPRTLAAFKDTDIKFDVQPLPVVVPKMKVNTGRKGLLGLGR